MEKPFGRLWWKKTKSDARTSPKATNAHLPLIAGLSAGLFIIERRQIVITTSSCNTSGTDDVLKSEKSHL